ncbi:helix-turn-helix domain-containing protein [Pluralibacter gergoviae]|uniref:helix-turn-helix domain-containing protein n=1 Tax=Pluralibacter gergoviae TaxID=61647 RepID=UPI0006C6DB85|nr:helix-turn-helix domain-containing protein [Pluralibacter gergoviae]EKZ9517716.1 helix-turn-helix domain-containing protein [Pluralibacter gergoviae]ELC3019771.1 helix-turn-helix domain-containing protein [Pluralibacter gergoviae]ELC3024769.1 helix-turn-helix domain-containing protein [Pluralibacter gergoviae]KOQ99009.1 hypothetical protein ABW48_12100 [Pluralibacter gergoviae]
MDRITLTRAEAAELLGISIHTLDTWVRIGRLKAYRMSDKAKSPYLFLREDCMDALRAGEVKVSQKPSIPRRVYTDPYLAKTSPSAASKELRELLKVRTKRR